MGSGGARNRSGPQKQEHSGRSDRAGLSLTALPSEGYRGEVPQFPIGPRRIFRWEHEDKHRFQVFDEESTAQVAEREAEMWAWAWTTPQAVAWAREPWRWMTVAMWVRTFVLCEGDDASAADKGSLHRFADQIGLTPAGLKENGWKVASDETAERRSAPAEKPDVKKRFAVVADGGA